MRVAEGAAWGRRQAGSEVEGRGFATGGRRPASVVRGLKRNLLAATTWEEEDQLGATGGVREELTCRGRGAAGYWMTSQRCENVSVAGRDSQP